MRDYFKTYYFLMISYFLSINFSYCQVSSEKEKIFTHEELLSYEIESNVYDYWSFTNENLFFQMSDTLPYFVDDRLYKGLINYGIKFSHIDRRNVTYTENHYKFFINSSFSDITFNQQDSTLTIEGVIDKKSGAGERDFNIFIGKKRDSTTILDYSFLVSIANGFVINFKGKQISDHVVLDSFPSFYLQDYKQQTISFKSDRTFKIQAKINENSLFILGSHYSYSKIFEVGKLVFDNIESRQRRITESKVKQGQNRDDDFKVIIRNNVQELYKDTITKPKLNWYYQTVETAEEFIIGKQYGKARDEYNKLLGNNHYIFARDLHNAVRIAILSRSYDTAIVFCERLALKGVPLSYFDAEIFDRLKTNILWQDFLTNYPKLFVQYEEGLNHNLIERLEELVQMDQTDYIKNTKKKIGTTELRNTTQRVDGELIKLIEKEGFPTEEKIGVKIYQNTMISTTNDYYVLISHSHQMNSDRLTEIQMIIEKSARNFEYDNVRNNLGLLINLNPCFMLYKGNLYNDKSCTLNRKELQKIEFRYNNAFGFIVNQGAMGILAFSKENEVEDEKFFKERYNFIEKLTDDWFIDD